ncbi:MAG: FkbM family methyltransferase [Nocardioidaceae bacterium]|nr:FkbM family methyltransferase [Nocardioidaceae bacterium]
MTTSVSTATRPLRAARRLLGESRVHRLGRLLRRTRIRLGVRRVTFRGVRLELDPHSANSESVLAGRFERALLDFVIPRVPAGGFCVDVGAHVGYWTVPLAAAVGPTGHVVAIEAHEPNVLRLRRNLDLNDLTNTDVLNAAAQDRSGQAQLGVSGTSSSWNSLVSSGTYFQDSVSVVTVPAVSLDALTLPESIDLLKIDVEGAEDSVLAGAATVLPRCSMLVLEIGGLRVTSESYVASVTQKLFDSFPEVHAVDKSADRLVPVGSVADLRTRWIDRQDVTKVVAVRRDAPAL